MRNLLRLLLVLLVAVMMFVGQSGMALGQAGRADTQGLAFDHSTTGFLLNSTHKQVPCETCHTSGLFKGTPRDCSACHAGAGARAPGKTSLHIPTSADCGSCHRPGTVSWSEAPTLFMQGATGHVINPALGVTTDNCQTCHNGAFVSSNASTKPASHIPTTASCGSRRPLPVARVITRPRFRRRK